MANLALAVAAVINFLKTLWDVGQAVVVVLVVLLFVLGKLPGARLIRRTLFQGQVLGPFRALRDLIASVWTLLEVAPTHVVRPRSLRRAVRVWVEMAIFDPRPGHELPEGKPWQKKWREAFWEHRGIVKEWKECRKAALRQLIDGKPVVITVAT